MSPLTSALSSPRESLQHPPLPEKIRYFGGGSGSSWPTLLVVDHDTEMLRALTSYFEKRGFHVAAAASLEEAREYFHRRREWTLIIAEYHLPDGTGWELCCWVRDQARDTPFLLMSGSPSGATLCAGTEFLAKPFPLGALEDRVRALLHR